jgi:hypothetical protein
MTARDSKCVWPRCKKASVLIYLDKGLCAEHWRRIAEHTAGSADETAALAAFGFERINGIVKRRRRDVMDAVCQGVAKDIGVTLI